MTQAATPPPLPGRIRARLALLTAMARAALAWERLWPRLTPLAAVIGGFISVALLDLLPLLAFWLHVAVLAGFVLAAAAALRYLWRGRAEYAPSDDAARHRIERDSRVDHRPLTALEDRPLASEGPAAEALWAAHLARMRGLLGRLRVGVPSPGMARRDPLALRAALALLVVISIAAGGRDAGARFERALTPKHTTAADAKLALDIWITPPAYTRLAPLLLQGVDPAKPDPVKPDVAQAASAKAPEPSEPAKPTKPAEVAIPVGSTVLAQLGRARGTAQLVIGERAVTFSAFDAEQPDAGRRVETAVDDDDLEAGVLAVRLDDDAVRQWPIRVVPDRAPTVEFLAPPANQGRGLLQMRYEAIDDYALSGLRLEIRHGQGWPLPGGGEVAEMTLPLPDPGAAKGEGQATRDFSDHPWAGETVKLALVAVDAAGQEGETDAIELALPARTFNHPVARALVAARRKLNRPGDDALAEAEFDIGRIASQPAHFFHDTVVYLALSFARGRLRHGDDAEARVDVQRLLWETALRIEDGEFAIAERELRDIQDRLEKALKRGADDAEIERLMDELQRAMDKYMSALAEHLKRKGLTQPMDQMSPQAMDSQDLQRMLDQARELSQSGARDAARQMLSKLNQMLKSLRNGARLAQPSRRMNKGRKMLKGLRDLARRQQQLLDRTFRRQQQRLRDQQLGPQPGQQQQGRQQQGQQQQGQQGQLAPDQNRLRRDLGRMMLQMDEMLGAIPPSMGQAERAMKGAGQALGEGDTARATRDQTEALNALRRATDAMAEQMARQGQGAPGVGVGQPRGPMGRGRDPFGRRPGNAADGSVDNGEIKVPSKRDMLRAREIMQELRRRSGEQFRPRPERDYIDRLIKRF